jgi:hypothetical protein
MPSMCAQIPARASSVITGPDIGGEAVRIADSSSRSAPFSIVEHASAMSSCRHRIRSAEQRWPALSKAEASTSLTTCSGSAEESTISAFWPPVSAISGIGGRRAQALGKLALDQARDRGRAGEHHAADTRIRDQRRADSRRARQELQRRFRHAGFVQQAHGGRGDQRRLLGRLGEHRVAGGERRGHLAGEDRERKIPRADAGDRPERRVAACGLGRALGDRRQIPRRICAP